MHEADRGVPDSDETRPPIQPAPPSEEGDPDATIAPSALAAETDHSMERPAQIGAYPILDELGRGGMGVVYLARDPNLDRRIALKVLPEQFAGNSLIFDHFQREARLLASMNHPNIATIYSLEAAEGIHFLTMELIPGQSLAEKVREGPLPLDDCLALSRQVAVALEAAHRGGIVHLDLKPQNIMVTPDDLVKVLDFGLAMALGIETTETGEVRTRSRMQEAISGTPGYMSPEQIRGEAVDPRTDIFAFGAILYECFTGRPVFSGADARERMDNTLNSVLDPAALEQAVPPRLREILLRCLSGTLSARPESIAAVRRQIEEEIALRSQPAVGVRAEAVPNNLPAPIAGFVGREKQRAEVARLLGEHRLVTLTGVGGGGKTRLSLEVARDLLHDIPDGAWLVELAPLASGDLVPGAVAEVFKLPDEAGVAPAIVLARSLREKSPLLILDNCEHVLDEVARLTASLLSACPGLRICDEPRRARGRRRGDLPRSVPERAPGRGCIIGRRA